MEGVIDNHVRPGDTLPGAALVQNVPQRTYVDVDSERSTRPAGVPSVPFLGPAVVGATCCAYVFCCNSQQ